jgi:hypothetical protein
MTNWKERNAALKKRRGEDEESNPDPTDWPELYGKGNSTTDGDYGMSNYGNYNAGGGFLSDAIRKPGEVWRTAGGSWGAKHPSGDVEYFNDEDSARGFSSGQAATQPPLSAQGDENPFGEPAAPEEFGYNQTPNDAGQPAFGDFPAPEGDDHLCAQCGGGAMRGSKLCMNCAGDSLGNYGDEESRIDPEGPECQFCGGPTADGFCQRCHNAGYDDRDELDKPWGEWPFNEPFDESIILMGDLLERNYKQEYERYQSRPEQKKRRAQRNKTRRKFEREGKVKKGDGLDIHHRDGNPFNQHSKNTVAMPKSKNRAMKERHDPNEEPQLASFTEEASVEQRFKDVIKPLIKAKLLEFLKSKRGIN